MWPFRTRRAPPAPEIREGPYTDAVVRQIVEATTSAPVGDAGDTAALEAAAGVISRAFASARVHRRGVETDEIGPTFLAGMARDLVVGGQAVAIYHGGIYLRASHWEIAGRTADPARWRYTLAIPTPDGELEFTRALADVAHARYSIDVQRTWIGVAPMARARAASRFAGAIEQRIGEEGSGPAGSLLPIPAGGDDASVQALKGDIQSIKGKTAIVETTQAGWGEGRAAAPSRDWQPTRIGAAWPATHPQMYTASQLSVLAACGVPVELLQKADGTGQREAWRRCLHGTIEPLGRILSRELGKIAGAPVSLDFERLFASDIAGRARAFQSLVGGGMDVGAAAAASGLIAADE